MTPTLTAALEVRGRLDGDLPCLGAIAHLQSRANTPVQLPPPRMSQVLVEHLGIKGMLNAVTPSTHPIRCRVADGTSSMRLTSSCCNSVGRL
jgi:hypothetical protein